MGLTKVTLTSGICFWATGLVTQREMVKTSVALILICSPPLKVPSIIRAHGTFVTTIMAELDFQEIVDPMVTLEGNGTLLDMVERQTLPFFFILAVKRLYSLVI